LHCAKVLQPGLGRRALSVHPADLARLAQAHHSIGGRHGINPALHLGLWAR
jgi:hypothetical protein